MSLTINQADISGDFRDPSYGAQIDAPINNGSLEVTENIEVRNAEVTIDAPTIISASLDAVRNAIAAAGANVSADRIIDIVRNLGVDVSKLAGGCGNALNFAINFLVVTDNDANEERMYKASISIQGKAKIPSHFLFRVKTDRPSGKLKLTSKEKDITTAALDTLLNEQAVTATGHVVIKSKSKSLLFDTNATIPLQFIGLRNVGNNWSYSDLIDLLGGQFEASLSVHRIIIILKELTLEEYGREENASYTPPEALEDLRFAFLQEVEKTEKVRMALARYLVMGPAPLFVGDSMDIFKPFTKTEIPIKPELKIESN